MASGTFKKKKIERKVDLRPNCNKKKPSGPLWMAANRSKAELFDQLRISFLQIATLRALKCHTVKHSCFAD